MKSKGLCVAIFWGNWKECPHDRGRWLKSMFGEVVHRKVPVEVMVDYGCVAVSVVLGIWIDTLEGPFAFVVAKRKVKG